MDVAECLLTAACTITGYAKDRRSWGGIGGRRGEGSFEGWGRGRATEGAYRSGVHAGLR